MTKRRPVPLPSSDYGSADEETNRLFRQRGGTLPGTKIGIPGRNDSPQNGSGRWEPGPIPRRK